MANEKLFEVTYIGKAASWTAFGYIFTQLKNKQVVKESEYKYFESDEQNFIVKPTNKIIEIKNEKFPKNIEIKQEGNITSININDENEENDENEQNENEQNENEEKINNENKVEENKEEENEDEKETHTPKKLLQKRK